MSKNTPDHVLHEPPAVEVVDITPEVAGEMLTHNRSNRNVREKTVRHYARDMRNDDWHLGDTIKFDWNGRLIDGQHRLIAVAESGTTQRFFVVRNLPPEVQVVIDSGAKRTGADALRFEGHTNYSTLIAAASRIAMDWESGGHRRIRSGHSNFQVTSSELVRWVERHPRIEEAAAFASQHSRSVGGTPSATGFIVYILLGVDAEATIEFYSAITDRRLDGKGDPKASLMDAFASLNRRSIRLDPSIQINLTFRAWNRWREGKTISTASLLNFDARTPEPK